MERWAKWVKMIVQKCFPQTSSYSLLPRPQWQTSSTLRHA